MELELVEYLQGLFSLIYVVITLFVGIRIVFRYFKYKKRDILLIGISWIGFPIGWLPDAINFLMIILIDSSLSREAYLIIGFAFLPAFILCWLTGIMDLLKNEKPKLILMLYCIICVIYEIIFWYLLFTDISQIGTFLTPFQVEFSPLIEIFLFLFLFIMATSGILFSRPFLKSKNPEIKLKGILLLAAFISFSGGVILDILIPLTPITVVIARCILILSSLLFYFGYLKKIEEIETKPYEEKYDAQEFLKMIASHKHKKLTEEEITFYREQKICLVCKGKTSRFTYICPKCDALYCMKCAEALSNLENYCWVCLTPFDESKPVNLPEKEVEEMDIEISDKPQKKPKL